MNYDQDQLKQLKQLKHKDIKVLREQLYNEQNGICPILKQEFSKDQFSLDHQHKRKNDPIGINGDGLIRGCINIQVNAFEGKILGAYKRCGLHKLISLPALLRNLADYLDQENLPYIHPSDREKPKRFMKRSYNALKGVYNERKKFPEYPETQFLTKPLKKLFKQYNINPEFYS